MAWARKEGGREGEGRRVSRGADDDDESDLQDESVVLFFANPINVPFNVCSSRADSCLQPGAAT